MSAVLNAEINLRCTLTVYMRNSFMTVMMLEGVISVYGPYEASVNWPEY